MSDNQDIKKSFKATSLFGGVQIFNIFVSIVRSKLVALLIGPVGIGIVELYNSTITLIGSLTDFSLNVSAVRDVSLAYKSGDTLKFKKVISLFSRIVWFTGLLGTTVCLLGSPLWSKLTFGDYNYTIGFIFLSIVLLFNQLKSGKILLLQSTEHFKYIAYSGIIGNIIGLLTTVPIYYYWGIDGIIPVLIIAAFFPYLLAYYYTSKLDIEYENVNSKELKKKGVGMLRQGFLLSLNFLLSTLVFYLLRVVVNKHGGVAEVGLYSSGFAIVTTYIGLIMQSMGQEYYPRLSTLSLKKQEFNEAIDKQIYFSLLLLGPMVICFLVFSKYLLIILYSERFVGATMFMALSMLGVVFQVPSWCMGFSFLAKGDNKAFLLYETIAKAFKLFVDLFFYYLWGLTGLGLSFIVAYFYYTLQCAIICNRRYGLVLSRSTIFLLISYFLIGSMVLIVGLNLPLIPKIIVGFFSITIATIYSYRKLDKMMDISKFLKRVIAR